MTANQLRYHELLETNRSNKEREKENTRHNLATEVENVRSHVAAEVNNRYATDKSFQIQHLNYLENHRTNIVREGIMQQEADTKRLQQIEQGRSNRANEALGSINATTNIATTLETMRTNRVKEALENQRIANDYEIKKESNAETHRANVQREQISFQNLAYNYSNLEEIRRHNQTTEGETKRHNLIGEAQKNIDLLNDSNSIKFNTLSNVLRSLSGMVRIGGLK